jgi:hypothetical protein
LSDTVNDTFITDPEALDRCNEALAEEFETVVATYERYKVSEKLFTLTGGAPGTVNVDRINLPDDFLKELIIIKDPTASNRTRIDRLASLSELTRRNKLCFDLIGGQLVIIPAERASGSFQLLYTPQAPALCDPNIVNQDAGDGITRIDGTKSTLFLPNGQFDQGYVTATVTLAGCSNAQNNGTWTITAVASTTTVTISGNFITETFGPGVTASSQPLNSFPELPVELLPWYEYIITGAAIRIKDKKQQPTDVLERRLISLKARIEQLAADRASDPQQIPLTQTGDGVWESWP